TTAHWRLTGQWNREANAILCPNPKPYHPPVDALYAPDLLDWVGLSFIDPTTKIQYAVADAGTSVTEGAYFVLTTQDGCREQVSTKSFAAMVKDIPMPSDED
ncbi:hypothetical protein BV25DRAFT_1824644, partial [Artomyces pyxidatus]